MDFTRAQALLQLPSTTGDMGTAVRAFQALFYPRRWLALEAWIENKRKIPAEKHQTPEYQAETTRLSHLWAVMEKAPAQAHNEQLAEFLRDIAAAIERGPEDAPKP